jgi:hypothetical protein
MFVAWFATAYIKLLRSAMFKVADSFYGSENVALIVGNLMLLSARNNSNWLFAHLNELAQGDFELLEQSKIRFYLVHSPRSHRYFTHCGFPFRKLHALGFNICVGTDSLASNENLSLFAEMCGGFQKELHRAFLQEILQMVTVNPARVAAGKPSWKNCAAARMSILWGAVYWWQCVRTDYRVCGRTVDNGRR